jgi:alanine racemase
MVRIGGLLYGMWRDVINRTVPPLDWRPVMSVRTRIGLIKQVAEGSPLGYGGTFVTSRPSLIATIPIGYEDGLRRRFGNRGKVMVRGRFVPIVGRISMDSTLLDVTDLPDVSVGDEAVILGKQGSVEQTAEDLAEEIGTISYEITCGLSERVPRLYRGTQNGLP